MCSLLVLKFILFYSFFIIVQYYYSLFSVVVLSVRLWMLFHMLSHLDDKKWKLKQNLCSACVKCHDCNILTCIFIYDYVFLYFNWILVFLHRDLCYFHPFSANFALIRWKIDFAATFVRNQFTKIGNVMTKNNKLWFNYERKEVKK